MLSTFSSKRSKVQKEELTSLLRGVKVLGFSQTGQLILVTWQAAEEDGTAQGQDSGTPSKTIGPVEEIVTLKDQLLELNWVYDESDGLNNHNNDE